jgi:hypothetical protein
MANAHRTDEQKKNHEEFRKTLEAEYGTKDKPKAAKKAAASDK